MSSLTANHPCLPSCSESLFSGSDSVQLVVSHFSLLPNSKLSSQGRPPYPPPHLLSPPVLPYSPTLCAISSCEITGSIEINLGQTHTPSAHFSCLLIPLASFLFPNYSPLSLFLGLKGTKLEPVCDYVSCPLALEGHTNIPLPEAVNTRTASWEGTEVTKGHC